MKIIVPMVPWGANKIKRAHWALYKKERECWQRFMHAMMGRQAKPTGKVHVAIHVEHVKLFDPDNLVSAAKIPLDCLKRLEVIADDSPAHITLSVTQEKSRERQTTITVEEVMGEKRESEGAR